MITPPRARIRRDGGLYTMEEALRRCGFDLVAGVDEAGRGACAGPLVVAAVALRAGRSGRIPGVDDSKRLSAAEREQVYEEVIRRAADHAVVVIPAAEVDTVGLGTCNLAGMRRAVAGLTPAPEYVLTDGFPVPGLSAPNLAVWKGDQVAASVSAASVLAKVTRDRIMVELDARYPEYGFAEHKGYGTRSHQAALASLGPCSQHRRSYSNVAAHVGVASAARALRTAHDGWQ